METEKHLEEIPNPTELDHRLQSVEAILNYRFKDRELLEAALTHPSATTSPSSSYQRLEFVGNHVLNYAVANHLFFKYPSLQPDLLSLLTAATISNEKLARVAVLHNLHKFIDYKCAALEQKIKEFVVAVMEEDNKALYGGVIRAPKVLVDIVESIAAAICIDCKNDVNCLWKIFKDILEPIFTQETLVEHPQPVTLLFELCQKLGKSIEIKITRLESESETLASVYVNEKNIANSRGDNQKTAKLIAARKGLEVLAFPKNMDGLVKLPRIKLIDAAKVILHQICVKMNWVKPSYIIEKEEGPSHDRKYTCSVQIEVEKEILCAVGERRTRVKDSKNSAAMLMIEYLLKTGCVKRVTNHLKGREYVNCEVNGDVVKRRRLI